MQVSVTTENVLLDVATERKAQDAQWGQQDHTNIHGEGARRSYASQADYWKQVNAARVADDVVSWDGILLEEVYEAISEAGGTSLRDELVQVAAVAVAWIECLDRATASAQQDATPKEVSA